MTIDYSIKVTQCEPMPGYRLKVTCSDGATGIFDMTAEHPYLLGVLGETVYYLAYEPDGETTLGPGLLRQLPRRGTPTVIYADRCVIDDDKLNELNVVFKQIPRQIARV